MELYPISWTLITSVNVDMVDVPSLVDAEQDINNVKILVYVGVYVWLKNQHQWSHVGVTKDAHILDVDALLMVLGSVLHYVHVKVNVRENPVSCGIMLHVLVLSFIKHWLYQSRPINT